MTFPHFKPLCIIVTVIVIVLVIITIVGRGGSLVDSTPIVRRVMGSNPSVAATQILWASPSLAVACGVKLRNNNLSSSV